MMRRICNMNKKELIDFISRYNRWRKGADIPMPHPKDVGVALEAVLAVLRDFDADVVDFILKDYKFND